MAIIYKEEYCYLYLETKYLRLLPTLKIAPNNIHCRPVDMLLGPCVMTRSMKIMNLEKRIIQQPPYCITE